MSNMKKSSLKKNLNIYEKFTYTPQNKKIENSGVDQNTKLDYNRFHVWRESVKKKKNVNKTKAKSPKPNL